MTILYSVLLKYVQPFVTLETSACHTCTGTGRSSTVSEGVNDHCDIILSLDIIKIFIVWFNGTYLH